VGGEVIDQLRVAHETYSKEGTVLALIALTTAERVDDELTNASEALSSELRLPVEVILKPQMKCRRFGGRFRTFAITAS
jgi:hypothetical protein